MLTQTQQLKCLISSSAGIDLSQLQNILVENNIEILDPAKFAPGAFKIIDKIVESINHADLVIGILGTVESSSNVLFELGCASALGKQTLVIIPEHYEIPSDLKDLLYIRTTPSDREAVQFAIEQIVNSLQSENIEQNTREGKLIDKTKPLGSLVDDFLILLDSSDHLNGHGIALLVLDILKASGVKTKHQQEDLRGADFAIWMDELYPYFGNPILIEIKEKITTTTQAEKTVNQVLRYLSLSHTKTIIVLTTEISSEAMTVISSYPNLYFFEIRDLLKKLREESLGEILSNERNTRVHGILR